MRTAEQNNPAFMVGDEVRSQARSFDAMFLWQFLSLLLTALVTGVFWGTWLGLSRSMATLRPETFLEVGHAMIGNLGTIMAILMPAAILVTLPVLWLEYRQRSRAFYWTLAGWVLFVITLLITLIVEVPIDNLIEKWTVATLPDNWQQLRDRWELFHALRSWVAVFSLALLIIGALFRRDNTTDNRR